MFTETAVCVYVINCRIAWADAFENLRFARFNAPVLVSSEDQDYLGNGDLQLPPLVGMANIYPPDLVELDAGPQQNPQALSLTTQAHKEEARRPGFNFLGLQRLRSPVGPRLAREEAGTSNASSAPTHRIRKQARLQRR